jgi:hypothetical protein
MSQHRMLMTKQFDQEPPSEYTANLIISSNVTNYDIRAACIADGWDGTSDLVANVTINAGVYVRSTSVSLPSLDTNSSGSFPATYSIILNVYGSLMGRGGNGGDGADAWAYANNVDGGTSPTSGTAGGDTIRARAAISINNQGTIWAGGGGGGGGGRCTHAASGYGGACAGSGGGGGQTNGLGGDVGTRTETVAMISTWQHATYNAAAGIAGTDTAPGSGVNSDYIRNYESTGKGSAWVTKAYAGAGGAGGYGSVGGGGAVSNDYDGGNTWLKASSASGGAAGYYVRGVANVTWINLGTVVGSNTP